MRFYVVLVLLVHIHSSGRCADVVLPRDAGCIDVREKFGALGDGVADDSVAIQKALDSVPERGIIYFPTGSYRITRSLNLPRGAILQGRNRETTVLKLEDHFAAFTDAKMPQALLTAGSALSQSVLIFNLALDCGRENPGAVGIDFAAQSGAIDDAAIRSTDGAGHAGLDFTRTSPGACWVKNVRIDGFENGIRAEHGGQNLTIEGLTLASQKSAGVFSRGNALAIRQLVSRNAIPALEAGAGGGSVTLIDAELSGGGPHCAIVCNEPFRALNVSSSGYPSVLKHMGETLDHINLTDYRGRDGDKVPPPEAGSPLDGSPEETPQIPPDNVENWSNVNAFADRVKDGDWAPSLQAAIDSGRTTLYLPTNFECRIRQTVHLRGKVRRIVGMLSSIRGDPADFADKPMFHVVTDGHDPIALEQLEILSTDAKKSVISLDLARPGPVVLRHCVLSVVTNAPGCGPLFMENVTAAFRLTHPQKIFAHTLFVRELTGITESAALWWILGRPPVLTPASPPLK